MSFLHWPAPNILALYHLESTADASGNSHTLTNSGSVGFGLGCALFGNANNSKYLYHNDGLGKDLTGEASMAAWFYIQTLPASGETQTIISWATTTGSQRYHHIQYLNDSGTKKLRADCAGTNLDYAIDLETNKWYKVDFNIANNCELFLNGRSVGTGSRGTSGNAYNQVSIGSRPWTSPATYFKGNIDEVVYFNGTRSASIIKKRYACDKGMLL